MKVDSMRKFEAMKTAEELSKEESRVDRIKKFLGMDLQSLEVKLDALDKCCRYTRPVLKSSEIKESKDYTLRVTVKKFGEVEGGSGAVVDVTPEIVPLLAEKHGPNESTGS